MSWAGATWIIYLFLFPLNNSKSYFITYKLLNDYTMYLKFHVLKKKKKTQCHYLQSHISKGCPVYKRCWGVYRRCIINFSGEDVVRCIRFSKRSNFEWINPHKWIKIICLYFSLLHFKIFSFFPSCLIWFCISLLYFTSL